MAENPFESLSVTELRATLLSLLRDRTCRLFTPTAAPDLCVQIQHIFDGAPGHFQERLKDSVLAALTEWRRSSHGFAVLRDLAHLAGLIRATETARILGHLVTQQTRHARNDSDFTAIELAVTSLTGFTPHPGAHTELLALFYSPALDPRFGGQAFIGLCNCLPAQYWTHVTRLRTLVAAAPGHVNLLFLGAQLLHEVGPYAFVTGFGKLGEADRSFILPIVQQVPNSAIAVDITRDAVRLRATFAPARMPTTFRLLSPSTSVAVATAAAPFSASDPNELILAGLQPHSPPPRTRQAGSRR